MMKTRFTCAIALIGLLVAAACGGGAPLPLGRNATDVKAARMKGTFAGKDRCNPAEQDRPFVIDWDATDMSSFEARAADDIVFVRYEGCELKVLDSCVDDSVHGSLGSYKAVDWTSGSVETLDVNDEGDLYAKLPLGAASLGARVQGGEKFHMEYFVSGTRSATRDGVARADLTRIAGCQSATHFVYAYNLGAFALGAQSNLQAQAGGTVWGFGAGGGSTSQSKAEKAGGDLSTCRGESAKDVRTCRVPIRLTLRAVSAGESADSRDGNAPETASAANLAGRLQATTAREKRAQEHAHAAETKQSARDGSGCLSELDAHDQLDPRPSGLSSSAESALAATRARCLMLAGRCSPGKVLFRQNLEKTAGATLGPNELDDRTDQAATEFCQGGTMSERDRYLKSGADLKIGAYKERKSAAFCASAYAVAKGLVGKVNATGKDDPVRFVFSNVRTDAPLCLARAGDCGQAMVVFKEAWRLDPAMNEQSRHLNTQGLETSFYAVVPDCAPASLRCVRDSDCASGVCAGGQCVQ
jgi:hypothetical protein